MSTRPLPAILPCLAFVALLAASCTPNATSSRGFKLPDGDPEQGRVAFERLYCQSCHSIVGEEFPDSPLASELNVGLGGQTIRVKTYGELVTSIINPSHRIRPVEGAVTEDGRSFMPNYNATLTVQELIDLVAFLQEHYEVVPPGFEYTPYTY